jgi:hypothetical protein
MTQQTPEEFGAAFDSKFRRSAFRLELLDRYVAADETEPLRRFHSGEPQDPSWREPWAQYVRAALRDGKQMARVHVVDEPLSEYLEFELTCGYPASVAAGEDVRILPRHPWPSHLWLPDRDFWLFDDREAVVMIYDEAGNFIGAETTSDLAQVERYRQAQIHLMQDSMPLADYLASLEMNERAG